MLDTKNVPFDGVVHMRRSHIRFVYVVCLMILNISMLAALILSAEAIFRVLHVNRYPVRWAFAQNFMDTSGNSRFVHGWYVPDTRLIYRSKPYVSDITDQYGFRIMPNSNGKAVQYQPDSPTVVAIGDSFTWGDGAIQNDETFPYYLHQRTVWDGYRTINAGTAGYHEEQEFSYLRDEIIGRHRFHPKIVVWSLYVNDLDDSIRNPLFFVFRGFNVDIPSWINGIYLSRVLFESKPRWLINSYIGRAIMSAVSNVSLGYVFYPTDKARAAEAEDMLRGTLVKMKALAEREHFKVFIFLAPNKGVIDGDSKYVNDYARMVRVLRDTDSPFVDLHPYFHQADASESSSIACSGWYQDESDPAAPPTLKHLTACGNRRYANIVYDTIRDTLRKR